MQHIHHIHLTNSEIGAIEDFNGGAHGYSITYSPRKRRFILHNRQGAAIDSGAEVWNVIDSAFVREQLAEQEIEKVAAV